MPTRDRFGVPSQREQLLTARHVPHHHRPILASRRQPFSVLAKRHALDVGGVPFQRERRLIRFVYLNGLRLLLDRSGGVGLLLVSVRAVATFLTTQQRERESYEDHEQAHRSPRKQRSAANPTSKLSGGILHSSTLSSFLDDKFNVRCADLNHCESYRRDQAMSHDSLDSHLARERARNLKHRGTEVTEEVRLSKLCVLRASVFQLPSHILSAIFLETCPAESASVEAHRSSHKLLNVGFSGSPSFSLIFVANEPQGASPG